MEKIMRFIPALLMGLAVAFFCIVVVKLFILLIFWAFSKGFGWEVIPFIVVTIMSTVTFYRDFDKKGI